MPGYPVLLYSREVQIAGLLPLHIAGIRLLSHNFKMTARNFLLYTFSSLFLASTVAQNTTDNLKYVDQLIGSANGG